MPSDLLPSRLIDQLGPGATPREVFAGADGYSAVTPVIFEVDRPVRPGSLPDDGGDVFAVYDTATGERVPIRAEVPAEAARHGAPDTVVVAWPVTRYEFGHTYVARITDGLRPHAGGRLERPVGLDRDGDPHVERVRDALEAAEGPEAWERVVSATVFTVRSEGNATSELDRMVQIVRGQDHPVRDLRVEPPLLVPDAGAVVTGEVLISDFRDEHGVARAEHGPKASWEKFLMVLPRIPAGPDGAPVVIYGHGLTVAKETMLPLAAVNAEHGMATIGIDVPNHGDRQSGEGGYLLDLTTPRRMGRLASMPLQGIVDNVSLLLAVRDHLDEVELTAPAWLGRAEEQLPRLDTSRLLYEGTSMGGVLGAAFVALAPELEGGFLQVAGSGIADVIYHSLLWPLFMSLIPRGASTGDAYALMGAATMLLDHADNSNLVDRARQHDTPVFLAYGVGDGILPNDTSTRTIGLLDLPLVGTEHTTIPIPHRSTGSETVPSDGWGAAQIWSSSSVELRSFGAHISFAEPRSDRLLRQWLAGRLDAFGLPAS